MNKLLSDTLFRPYLDSFFSDRDVAFLIQLSWYIHRLYIENPYQCKYTFLSRASKMHRFSCFQTQPSSFGPRQLLIAYGDFRIVPSILQPFCNYNYEQRIVHVKSNDHDVSQHFVGVSGILCMISSLPNSDALLYLLTKISHLYSRFIIQVNQASSTFVDVVCKTIPSIERVMNDAEVDFSSLSPKPILYISLIRQATGYQKLIQLCKNHSQITLFIVVSTVGCMINIPYECIILDQGVSQSSCQKLKEMGHFRHYSLHDLCVLNSTFYRTRRDGVRLVMTSSTRFPKARFFNCPI